MTVKNIIKEALEQRPLGVKEALEETLKARIAVALEEKMSTISEAKAPKIACTKCDEVSTQKAWEKNQGTCPCCNSSTKGVKESLDEGHGVFMKGGSVGSKANPSKPVKVYDDLETAKAHAKRLNAQLSPGEKEYYKIRYHVKPVAEGYVVEEILREGKKDGYYVSGFTTKELAFNKPLRHMETAQKHVDYHERKTGVKHCITLVKDGIVKQRFVDGNSIASSDIGKTFNHHEGSYTHQAGYPGAFNPKDIAEEVEDLDEVSKDTVRKYGERSFRQANTLLKRSLDDQPKAVQKASAAALERRKKGIKMMGKRLDKDELQKMANDARDERY